MRRQSKLATSVTWVRVRKLDDDIMYMLLSKILHDLTSSSSTSSLAIMIYCTAVHNRKDEKAWYNINCGAFKPEICINIFVIDIIIKCYYICTRLLLIHHNADCMIYLIIYNYHGGSHAYASTLGQYVYLVFTICERCCYERRV